MNLQLPEFLQRKPAVALSIRDAAVPQVVVDDSPGGLIQAIRWASDLMQRAGIAKSAGKTFDGNRDLMKALGYKVLLSTSDMRSRYERGDVSARVVEIYPKETWGKGGPELIEDEDPETLTPFEEAAAALVQRLGMWTIFKRADILAGLGPYAVVLIGASGALETELPKLKGPEDILFLNPYGSDEMQIHAYENDPANARFGWPSAYKFKRRTVKGVTSGDSVEKIVHWSRVLHMADNVLDDRVNGLQLLQRVWNRLDDLDKVVGGGSEAFWKRVDSGMIFSVDKDVQLSDAQLALLKRESEEFMHGMRRQLAAKGFEATQLGSDVANFSNPADALLMIISAATGIPQRILMGSERGELASSQDAKKWDEQIGERRQDYAEPLVREFVTRIGDRGALDVPEEYDIRWPQFQELDQKSRAEVADILSKVNKQAGGPVILPGEIRERVLDMPKLTDEQIQEFEDMQPEPVEPPVDPNADPNAEEEITVESRVAALLAPREQELNITLELPTGPRKGPVTIRKKLLRTADGNIDEVVETREEA